MIEEIKDSDYYSQEDIDIVTQKMRDLANSVIPAFIEAIAEATHFIARFHEVNSQYNAIAYQHPRWRHLSMHARRMRTRKKWQNAIWKVATRKV